MKRLCFALAVVMALSLAGCGEPKVDRSASESHSEASSDTPIRKIELDMGTEIDLQHDSSSSSVSVESASEEAQQPAAIPNSKPTVKTVSTVHSKESTDTFFYKGMDMPVFDNWVAQELSTGEFSCSGSSDYYTVKEAPKYEINSSIFGMFFGGTSNYSLVQTVVADSTLAAGLNYCQDSGIPVIVGYLYFIKGDKAYLAEIADYSLTVDELWELVWSVAKGLGYNVSGNLPMSEVTGKLPAPEQQGTVWQATGTYKLPKMNLSTRNDVVYQIPADWQSVEINGVTRANSRDGHISFEMSEYNSAARASAEFGTFISQFVNNLQVVTRLKTYPMSELALTDFRHTVSGASEVVAVGNNVYYAKIYTTGSKVYRGVVSFKYTTSTDEERWLARQVFDQFLFATPLQDFTVVSETLDLGDVESGDSEDYDPDAEDHAAEGPGTVIPQN